jgi:hypothetical protein
MELTRILSSPAFGQWIAESLAIFFLLGGFVALAVGAGLFFRAESTLRFFGTVNRWVSMRHVADRLEIVHDTRPAVLRYRFLIAAVFIVGGAFALFSLITQFDAKAVLYVYRMSLFKPAFAAWLVDGAKWILIVGNIVAIVVGLALAFFPGAVANLEAKGGRWYSEPEVVKRADDLRLPLDQRVVAYPRHSGVAMMFFGLVLIGTFGIMLFGR